MVVGLDRFRTHFADHADRYVLIGGVATELALAEAGIAFRPTKDLDIVLLAEALGLGFVRCFWDFVRLGEYAVQAKATIGPDGTPSKRCLYRFQKPERPDFPATLELFSRLPDALDFDGPGHITPITVNDGVSSLSAILLDNGYYALIGQHRTQCAGLPVLREEALIVFKARAWLDLTERKAQGAAVDGRDIRKHATDIVRLTLLLTPATHVALPEAIWLDLARFVAQAPATLGDTLKIEGFGDLKVAPAFENLVRAFAAKATGPSR